MPTIGKKRIPAVTWKNISPPFTDYAYFSHAARYPFRPYSEAFDPVNAWWLIEAATLVYAAPPFVRTEFQKAGLGEVRFYDGGTTQCFSAGNMDFVIVAFRGTEVRRREGRDDFRNIIGDIMNDLDIRLTGWDRGDRVHRGFRKALDAVWKDQGLGDDIRKMVKSGRPVWITGHSLGAALAVLAADRSEGVRAVYTFGAPRIGDSNFRKHYTAKTYRVVNNTDLVTRLPPKGPYRHVGEFRYIDARGRILNHAVTGHGPTPGIFPQGGRGISALIPEGLKDHVPILYAVHIWNSLVD